MTNEREAQNGPEGPVEGEEEKRPAFRPIQALPPILLMGLFIIVTVGLSLIVGPLYDSYGLSSDFEQFAQGDYWYLYAFGFVVLMVVVAVVILLLRKLLKRRKLKLKYLFAFVVFTSTFVVVQPFVDMAFNGAPPVWERYDLDVDGAESAYPLDPADIGSGFIILTNSSFHIIESGRYSMEETYKVADLERIFPPHFKGGHWVISGTMDAQPFWWSIDTDGTVSPLGILPVSYEGMDFMGAQMEIVGGDL
ncbi:MAG: hypothetical protein ACMUHM_09270, partial [Thermoplasmatota archaeon]